MIEEAYKMSLDTRRWIECLINGTASGTAESIKIPQIKDSCIYASV